MPRTWASPEQAGWFLAGRLRPGPQPRRVLPCPACPLLRPGTPWNSHLCSVGLPPGLISQPYTLAGEGRPMQGNRSHWLGTCQNTGPQSVKSSPQQEGVWALLPWRTH